MKQTTSWRDLAIAVYKAPSDSRIYGIYDVDVTNVMEYIARKRDTGVHLTITHFMTAALARTLYEDLPDINCYVQRGRLRFREDANVFLAVSIEGGKGMTGMVVPKTQTLSASQIAEYVQTHAARKRAGDESGPFAAKGILAKIPWPFRRPLFLLIKWWIFEMGLPFPFLKISPDPFGSIMITNIGGYGLAYGMVALFPIGKLPAVATMGAVTEKAVVIDGEIKIRKMLPLTGTFDHRIVDGAQAGALSRGVETRLAHPELLDQPNPPSTDPTASNS